MRDTRKTKNISIQLTGKQLTLLISGIFLISVCSFILGVLVIRVISPEDSIMLRAERSVASNPKIPAAAKAATIGKAIVNKVKASIPAPQKKVEPKKVATKKENLTFFESLPDKNNVVAKTKQTAKPAKKTPVRSVAIDQKQKRTGKYTIQVASFSSRKDAEKLSKTLNKIGYDSYLTKADIPKKGSFFRVRIGNYSDRRKGMQQASRFFSSDGTRLSLGRPVIVLR